MVYDICDSSLRMRFGGYGQQMVQVIRSGYESSVLRLRPQQNGHDNTQNLCAAFRCIESEFGMRRKSTAVKQKKPESVRPVIDAEH